jgi:hypothetical protein
MEIFVYRFSVWLAGCDDKVEREIGRFEGTMRNTTKSTSMLDGTMFNRILSES